MLLYIDGFDYYGSSQLSQRGWSGAMTFGNSTTTRFGVGQCMEVPTHTSANRTIPENAGTLFVGAAINLGYAQSLPVISFYDGATCQIAINCNSNGTLYITRGSNSGTQLGSTTTYAVNFGVWNYWELSAVIASGTGGSVTLKINGQTILSVTGVNTSNSGNAYCNGVQFSYNSSGQYLNMDDLYICDASGSSPTNTFLGDVRVYGSTPSANGGSTQWAPNGAGSNYECVDSIPPNASDYVSSSTPGQTDLYEFPTIAVADTILGVQVSYFASKTDSGTRTIQSQVKSGTATADGTENNLSATMAYYSDIFYEDPNTSAAWTLSAVNDMQAGVVEVV